MSKATEIPTNDCGLKINVGGDGTWLQFTSEDGLSAAINVNNLAANKTGIIGRALVAWCDERQAQAVQIREANSQFGVGG